MVHTYPLYLALRLLETLVCFNVKFLYQAWPLLVCGVELTDPYNPMKAHTDFTLRARS